MSIGFWEVAFLIILLLGIVIVSRLVERFRTKRICPECGLAIQTHLPTCPSCHFNFPIKGKDR
ncbi:hypothetical protein F4Y93_13990 [Candidatus Poribacteria bacterium]|nr:hypothetical protein [Candidatus Poribacteria bacterium]